MLYDIRPFDINSVTDRVSIEHSCRQSAYEQHALLFDKNKQAESPKTKSKNQAEAGCKKKGFKDKRKGRNNNNQNTNHENDTNKRFEKIKKMLEKIQAANNIPSVNAMYESRDPSRTATSDSEAFIANEINAMVSKKIHGLIYLDSGAGRTVVNDLLLLVDPTPVKKQIHTFSTPAKALLKEGRIKGNFTQSSSCQVCQLAKIRNLPHSQVLPRANAPFLKIHMDTLQINPPTRRGYKYVLVLINDFSRFNRIYLLSEKGQAEECMKTYLMEIKNKLDITPAYLHTDRGGEFSSQSFLNHLASQGISLERGPPESPQTNGVAERFNKTLLYKVRCLLGKSNIPISFWDEAALHASLLLNMLPHKHLNMDSTTTVLKRKHSLIEPEINFHRLVPFGIRITTQIVNPTSKIAPQGEVLRALTFERYSDGLRLLNLETGKIRVSRDYRPAANTVMPTMHQPSSALPITTNDSHKTADLPEPASVVPTTEKLKKNNYVPYYKEAPRNISSSISQDNIVEGKRNACHADQLLLTDAVPYPQAVNDPIERTEWKKAMDAEFVSLMSHNTGELVPYPEKPTKVIGGMRRLTRKRNENGEVY
ncbi:hypothetical protein O181_017878 [Austropuccinia psidii MF-1]|uniref:Integrase catalytic domain-containing protein n=1 Tax=Austropuccinia psidii MF-1 TaxID=1389203 RepID=A0A9Q3GS65_9BASI|nr:hypothetical protein [Austropuccinia psidii MF-1]